MRASYVGSSLMLCIALLTACSSGQKQIHNEVAASEHTGDNVIYLDTRVAGYGSDKAALEALLAQHALVIVDFYADWCGPCRSLGEVITRVAPKYGNVIFVKVNIDKHGDIAAEHKVRGIPVLSFFKNGQKVNTKVGAPSASELSNLIERYLK